jgi:hypothetical protein
MPLQFWPYDKFPGNRHQEQTRLAVAMPVSVSGRIGVKRDSDLGISPVSQFRTLPKNSPEFENSSIGVQRDDNVYPSALNGGRL